ncbi:MAG: hypothetical protein P4L49_11325 [Desulfosporosinus sp.]|nr:hypothetical protein [Desulfosporosinus sp.]
MFALIISTSAVMFDKSNLFWAFYIGGWTAAPNKIFEGLLVTVVFLIAWLLYGTIMGYTKEKGFMKFVSLYWGIGGSICLTAVLMAPIGKFAIIAIPAFLLFLVPTYGLTYFYAASSNFNNQLVIICLILSWSAGAIGYLLGYQLKKLRVSTLSDK